MNLTRIRITAWFVFAGLLTLTLTACPKKQVVKESEEIEEIEPAIEAARAEGLQVDGPVPPDSLYLRAYRGTWDGIVAMYHDQGHIPQKLVAFEEAVNVTLGLPMIRTSVDHGTGFDIAGQGEADPTNMVAAIAYAVRMAEGGAATLGTNRPAASA